MKKITINALEINYEKDFKEFAESFTKKSRWEGSNIVWGENFFDLTTNFNHLNFELKEISNEEYSSRYDSSKEQYINLVWESLVHEENMDKKEYKEIRGWVNIIKEEDDDSAEYAQASEQLREWVAKRVEENEVKGWIYKQGKEELKRLGNVTIRFQNNLQQGLYNETKPYFVGLKSVVIGNISVEEIGEKFEVKNYTLDRDETLKKELLTRREKEQRDRELFREDLRKKRLSAYEIYTAYKNTKSVHANVPNSSHWGGSEARKEKQEKKEWEEIKASVQEPSHQYKKWD